MTASSHHLDQFLDRIHRRWMLIRAVERIGLCVLVSSTLAIVLSLILITRGESAFILVCVCVAIGALAGLFIGWLSRPSLFDTAVEIDRQLHLADLLATALSIRRSQTVRADSTDDQWSSTILAIAESRCASIAREPLLLRRFGTRAWGGIGLCTAIVLTLGALSTNPLVLHARTTSEPRSSDREFSSSTSQSPRSTDRAEDPTNERDPVSPNQSQWTQSQRAQSSINSTKDSTKSAAATDQTGSGMGQTDVHQKHDDLSGTSESRHNTAGDRATGGGDAASDTDRGDSAGSIAADSHDTPTLPWNSHDWPAAQQRANEEVRSGAVPDSYRDLVRDYFRR
jgi:hypothetical protein